MGKWVIGDRIRLRKDFNISGYCCGYKESQAAGTVYTVTKETDQYQTGTYFHIKDANRTYCHTHSNPDAWEKVPYKKILICKEVYED